MPSIRHEAPLLLLRERPSLVPELLRSALGVTLPEHDTVQIEDPGFPQTTPTEYRADLVLTLARGAPVMGLVVEVQLARDVTKPRTWLLYAAALHARLACRTGIVVVTPSTPVARWARRPVTSFQDGGFRPWVLGPAEIPVLDDPARAAANPELGVLSALAHGTRPEGLAVGRAVLDAVRHLDEARGALYGDLVFVALGAAARRALEAEMDLSKYEFQSEIGRKWFGAGRAEGREEGRREGREEGSLLAQAEAVLAVLSARDIAVAPDDRARIEACRDPEALRRWLARAVRAESIADIFT